MLRGLCARAKPFATLINDHKPEGNWRPANSLEGVYDALRQLYEGSQRRLPQKIAQSLIWELIWVISEAVILHRWELADCETAHKD